MGVPPSLSRPRSVSLSSSCGSMKHVCFLFVPRFYLYFQKLDNRASMFR